MGDFWQKYRWYLYAVLVYVLIGFVSLLLPEPQSYPVILLLFFIESLWFLVNIVMVIYVFARQAELRFRILPFYYVLLDILFVALLPEQYGISTQQFPGFLFALVVLTGLFEALTAVYLLNHPPKARSVPAPAAEKAAARRPAKKVAGKKGPAGRTAKKRTVPAKKRKKE